MVHNIKFDLHEEELKEQQRQREMFPLLDSLESSSHQIHTRLLGWQLASAGRRRRLLRALGAGPDPEDADPEALLGRLLAAPDQRDR